MSQKKIGILRFLGTNCDRDIWQAVESVGLQPEWLWYQDQFNTGDYGALVLPGGFSYGDYLRCGALAAKAPVMESLREAAGKGVPVMGICNGFQILCDSGLLPGVLVRNEGLRFIDDWVELSLANPCSAFGSDNRGQSRSRLPIAHGEGRYVIDEDGLKAIQDRGQIWWTYNKNPNGSVHDIAGVMNEGKNVAGLMPHPERALFDWMGGEDGRLFFESLL
ncbi:MAG: phosphoribosylformylglycinamidine synthase subunit PurQ [Bdellovibrionaceae bacterium]|nr:phosphoribosylformylglycinamidine synthase subunit PurQ [Bdellovibrionales bacterium]MCB9083901.1 phosphoribosylformylglycinamidine synthase subunit PurQ [Pseudobdellovibrionaceae bacterium]